MPSHGLESGDDDALVHRVARILSDVSSTLSSSGDRDARIERCLALLGKLVPYDCCALELFGDGDAERLFIAPEHCRTSDATRSKLSSRITRLRRRLDETVREDGDAEPLGDADEPATSSLAVPVAGFDRLEGILLLERKEKDAYDARSLALLTAFAGPLAAYLCNVRLRDSESRSSAETARTSELQHLMLAIVSHDLRNPLAAILNSAELLRNVAVDARQQRIASRMLSSCQRATRIVADLLDVSRARAGVRMPIRRREVDVVALVKDVVDETVTVHPDRRIDVELPKRRVNAKWDGERISQALANLLTNAAQHGRSTTPIGVRVRRTAAGVEMEVRNAGPVIPPAVLESIFDPFKRPIAGRHEPSRGLGLGLFIVREIIEAHGGTVTARSSPADGTAFALLLPQ